MEMINMNETQWKQIPGYPGYEASTDGNIRSIDRKDTAGRNRKGTQLKPATKANGYLMVSLRKNDKTVGCNVSRLVAQTFLPNPKEKPEVRHINNVRADNTVTNLQWVTKEENTTYTMQANPISVARAERLSDVEIKKQQNIVLIEGIKHDLMHTTMKFQDIAAKYGKHGSEVSRCNVGQRYYDETLQYPLRKRVIGKR